MRHFLCHAMIATCVVAFAVPAMAQDNLLKDGSASRVIQLRTSEAPPKPLQPAQVQSSRAARASAPTIDLPDPAAIGFDEIKTGAPQVSEAPTGVDGPVARQADLRSGQLGGQQPANSNANSNIGTLQNNPGNRSINGPVVDQNWNQKPSNANADQLPSFASESDEMPAIATSIAPQIATKIISPRSVNLNEPAAITVLVKNTSRTDAGNVIVTAILPVHAKLNSSNPQPSSVEGQNLTFSIPQISSGQAQEIHLELIPTQKKPMQIATTVRVQQEQNIAVAVRQPQLKLEISGPVQSNIGHWATHTVTVTNTGDGIARNIRLDRKLPQEFQIDTSVQQGQIESIQPGQSKQIVVKSLSTAAGEFKINFNVAAAGCEMRQASHAVRIFQPELQVSAASPELTFVNRDGIYSFQIENRGQVDVTNVVVSLATPSGIKVTTVSREAAVDQETGRLSWTFDRIPAAGSESIQLKALATTPGNQICELRVSSNETIPERFELVTQVQTHADVSIGLRNQNGPIEVGARTVFIVNVENRGSRIANGVEVAIELAPSLMPVASTSYEINELDNTIRFNSLDVPAGQTKELKFEVAGVAKGEHMVRGVVKMADSNRRLMTEDSVFVFEPDQSKVSEALKPQMQRR